MMRSQVSRAWEERSPDLAQLIRSSGTRVAPPAPASIAAQAKAITAEVEAQQGPTGLADKEITALTAYLQRLGTDIKWKRPQPQTPAFAPAVAPAATTVPAGAEAGASAR